MKMKALLRNHRHSVHFCDH